MPPVFVDASSDVTSRAAEQPYSGLPKGDTHRSVSLAAEGRELVDRGRQHPRVQLPVVRGQAAEEAVFRLANPGENQRTLKKFRGILRPHDHAVDQHAAGHHVFGYRPPPPGRARPSSR
jgi:hypothetical protein